MMANYIIIIWVTALFCSIYLLLDTRKVEERHKALMVVMYIALVIVATFRPSTMFDYEVYETFFTSDLSGRFEVGFVWLVDMIRSIHMDSVFIFGCIAVITVGLKLKAIDLMSVCKVCSILVYVSYFFLLHDMIQIRVAFASGLLLLGTKYIYDKKLIKYLLISSLAIGFHYSAMIMLLLWFINSRIPQRKTYVLLVVISYILAMMGVGVGKFIEQIPIDAVQSLFSVYQDAMDKDIGVNINLVNPIQLLKLVMCAIVWYKIEDIQKKCPMSILWIKIYTMSIIVFVLLHDIPVVSFRMGEFLQVVDILLIPTLIYAWDKKMIGKVLVFAYAWVFVLYVSISDFGM